MDALSASGLRALRYVLEVPLATHVTANDVSQAAFQSITRNISYNFHALGRDKFNQNKISPTNLNATRLNATRSLYYNPTRHHVIDLDPYGTAIPFIAAALQSLITKLPIGGLLCVTFTDAGVWASTAYSEKCFALYGGQPLKGEHCHEAGLRLILYAIASAAAKHGMAIEPLLSLSVDFYCRVFVRVWESPAQVEHLSSNTMIVYNCDSGCSSSWICSNFCRSVCDNQKGDDTWKFKTNQASATPDGNCQFCGFPMHIAGPMWSGPLHKADFLRSLLSSLEDSDKTDPEIYFTLPRVKGMIQTALSEATFHLPSTTHPLSSSDDSSKIPEPPLPPVDPPHFFHIPSVLSKTLHTEAPPLSGIRGALLHLGYRVTRSHCRPNSIKTTAPTAVIWEVMRSWCKLQQEKNPEKKPNIKEGMPGWNILFPSEEWINKNAEWKELRKWLQNKREELGGKDPIIFDEELGIDQDKGKFVRYQQNPTANWGPMRAARMGGGGGGGGDDERENESSSSLLLWEKEEDSVIKGKRKAGNTSDEEMEIQAERTEEKKPKYDVFE